MAERFDFASMQPEDGLRIERVQMGEAELSLHLTALSGGDRVAIPGEPTGSIELAKWLSPGPAEEGDCDRLQVVLEAVARYMTVGGDWEALRSAMTAMREMVPYDVRTPGWHYHSYTQFWDDDIGDVMHQHIFVADEDRGLDTEATVWVEGLDVQATTLGRLVEERRQEDEGEGPGDHGMELPGDEDPAVAQLDDRSSEA